MKLIMTVLLIVCLSSIDGFERKKYGFIDEPIDVIIPCVGKDKETLECCIEGIRENCPQVRRIIVVSDFQMTNNAEWFDEKNYPFDKKNIALYLLKGNSLLADQYLISDKSRAGWYYQQLLKLYAPFVIPGISTNVLNVDADTIFLNPVTFLDESGSGLYNPGSENHRPYFDHMNRFLPGLTRIFKEYSGISHHMIMQRSVLEDLFSDVESYQHMELWKAFCLNVSVLDLFYSGASEYEIYFNYVFAKTDQVKLRLLKWSNIPRLADLPTYKEKGYHYVSIHAWMRE